MQNLSCEQAGTLSNFPSLPSAFHGIWNIVGAQKNYQKNQGTNHKCPTAATVRAAAVTAGQTNYEVIFQAKSQRGGDLPLTVTSEHAQTPAGHRKG